MDTLTPKPFPAFGISFAQAAIGTIGNAGVNIMHGPGYANFDASVSRSIPIGTDRRQLKLRIEAFNAFNHAEFQNVSTSFTFNPANGQNTNASTGQYTSTKGPRILSLELRFQF